MQMIHESVELEVRLIDDLLDFTKISPHYPLIFHAPQSLFIRCNVSSNKLKLAVQEVSKLSCTRSARRSSPCRPTCHAPVDHIGDPLVLYELLQSCVATKGPLVLYEEKIEQNAIPRGVQQAQRVARR